MTYNPNFGGMSKAKTRRGGGSREETIEDVLRYPIKAIPERKIEKRTAEHFGIRTGLSESDGITPIAHYFPAYLEDKLVGFLKRDLKKPKQQKGHFSYIGFHGDQCDLFGMHCANKTGSKKVFITEGEYDAPLLWQTMKNRNGKGNPSCVSIVGGTISAVKNIGSKQNLAWIGRHDEVVLCFDRDRATEAEKAKGFVKGEEATARVMGLLPKAKMADFPDGYDPCQMVAENMEEQLYWSAIKPIEYVPEGFRTYDQFREKAHELPRLGRSWPWPTMTKETLGRREGEGYYIGGGVKCGKSELLNQLVKHIIEEDKLKPAVFKFEEANDITCKKIAGKMYHKEFNAADKVLIPQLDGTYKDIWGKTIAEGTIGYFTHEELVEATDAIGDKVIYYNNYGRAVWDEVKTSIRHAVLVEGSRDIFLDPITRFVQGMSASDANTELERISDELSKMAKDLNFVYYCFCHLNSPGQGQKSHEEGGKPKSNQFAGSRAMMR